MRNKQIKIPLWRILLSSICLCLSIFSSGKIAFADSGGNTLVPYSGSDGNNQQIVGDTDVSKSSIPDYAGEIFDVPEVHTDPSVRAAVASIQNILSKALSFIAGVAVTIIGAQIVIDMLCLVLKPLAVGLSKLPIQVYSDTVASLTGIAYTGPANANGGTAAAAPAPAPAGADGKDMSSKDMILFYVKKRIILIALALFFMTLIYSGVFFRLMFWLINHLVSYVDGVVK